MKIKQIFQRLKEKRNQKRYWTTLKIPAIRFFNAIEHNELRWIQRVNENEFFKCSESDLLDAYEHLSKLYNEALNHNSNQFDYKIRGVSNDLGKLMKLNAMIIAFYRLQCDDLTALTFLKEFGINLNYNEEMLLNLRNKILSYETMLQIRKASEIDVENDDKQTYVQLIVNLEDSLDTSIDGETITLEKLIAKINLAKEKAKQLKELTNGRKSKTK